MEIHIDTQKVINLLTERAFTIDTPLGQIEVRVSIIIDPSTLYIVGNRDVAKVINVETVRQQVEAGNRVKWRVRAVDYTGTVATIDARLRYALVKADNGKTYRVQKGKLEPIEASDEE